MIRQSWQPFNSVCISSVQCRSLMGQQPFALACLFASFLLSAPTAQAMQHRNSILPVAQRELFPGLVSVLAWADENPVNTERALRSASQARWYDQESQGYAPPKLSPEADNSIRRSTWIARAKPASSSTSWNLGISEFIAEALAWAAIGFVAVALTIGIVLLVLHATRNYVPSRLNYGTSKKRIQIDPTRVEDLPFDFVASKRDPLSEAEQLRQAGRYNEAIVYLFAYMLLALDQSRQIHLQKGKTNRMYLREVKSPGLKRIVEPTMLAFEEVFFGKYNISRERFELAWAQLDAFHAALTPPTAPAVEQSAGKVAPA